MLQQLTEYLLQFHRISIPGLGTIELVPQPATLDIVNKVIYPPHYKVVYSEKQETDEHQLQYLQTTIDTAEPVQQKLQRLGDSLKDSIRQQPFTWNGIGTFDYNAEQIRFKPAELVNPLQPVPANKVLREHVQHSVLIGDQVVLSDGTVEQYAAAKKARDLTITIGWIIAVLAAAFIAYYLYEHQFTPESSGLSNGIEQKTAPPTYK